MLEIIFSLNICDDGRYSVKVTSKIWGNHILDYGIQLGANKV